MRLVLLSAGVASAVAIYCLGYTALAGRPETVAQSFGWAIVNVLPWIPALEFAEAPPSAGPELLPHWPEVWRFRWRLGSW